MDLTYLEQILKLFEASSLTELEVDEEGTRVTLSRAKEQPFYGMPQMQMAPQYQMQPQGGGQQQSGGGAAEAAPAASGKKTHEVKSPIVGTYYRAPAPDADPYIQVGQHIEAGATLCIIEAMKLMNEIESDATGKIVKILVENGAPVEYGQPLVLLEID